MSYTEELARLILIAWYVSGFAVCVVTVGQEWWRLEVAVDKILNPYKYDANLREFRAYMKYQNGYDGIQIDAGEDNAIIVGNYCYPNIFYSTPPKYEAIL